MKHKRWVYFAMFFTGLVLNLFGLMGPVHEFFHWLVSNLAESPAKIVGWGLTAFDRPTLSAAVAGPFGEVLVLYILVYVFLHTKHMLATLFFLGAAHAAFLLGFTAGDFVDWVDYIAGFEVMVIALVVWTIVNAYMIVLAWIHIDKYFQERKKK